MDHKAAQEKDNTVVIDETTNPYPLDKKRSPWFWPLICLALFIGGFGVAFGLIRFVFKQPGPIETVKNTINQVQNPTVACPLNGVQYSKDQAQVWQNRRPLGVMIENHTQARPQAGLNEADVVYEVVAEGGITRFLAVFLCKDSDPVGPVRSARTFFLDWIEEYNGLYAHVGGAGTPGPADALGQIDRYGILDLDQFSIGSPTYIQDTARIRRGIAIEHTMFSSTQKLWQYAESKGWGITDPETGQKWDAVFKPWSFGPDGSPSPQASAAATPQSIVVPFWDKGAGDYVVKWTFDGKTNLYMRENGGEATIDTVNNQQISAKNLIIQFMTEDHADDGYPGNQHLLYGTIGQGDAWILINGTLTKGTWSKPSRTARTQFLDVQGNQIKFVPGKIWIEGVPTYNKQSIKITPNLL